MKRSLAWIVAPMAGILLAIAHANAQMAPSPYYPAANYPVQPAHYSPYGLPPTMGAAYGYPVAPAGYNAPMAMYDPHVMQAGFGGCACGGAGCNACGGGPNQGLLQGCNGCGGCASCGIGGGMGLGGGGLGQLGVSTPYGIGCNDGQGIWGKHGPQGTAGCCNPRWWDIQAEAMYLSREDVSREVNFASDGIAGPIVLSTNDLDFDGAPGFRLMGSYLLGPGTNLEGGYFGLFEWDTSAAVTSDTNNLFSAISNFGQINIVNLPEVNNSNFQSLNYESELHNWELNVRRRWVSPNCRFHSSLLVGARYLSLDEDFLYFVQAGDPVIGTTSYAINTTNDLVGGQIGGDLLLCVIPGLKIGGNLKAGLYGVRAENNTTILLVRPPDPDLNQTFEERAGDQDTAFVGEGGAEAIIEATERVTLRLGYQFLVVEGVALAPENFNPDFRVVGREAHVNHNGSVFYHGVYGGLEYTW